MANLGNMGVVNITVEQASIRAASFILEIDGMKVTRLELDGKPLRDLSNLTFSVNWENGELPQVVTKIPIVTMERFLIEYAGENREKETA